MNHPDFVHAGDFSLRNPDGSFADPIPLFVRAEDAHRCGGDTLLASMSRMAEAFRKSCEPTR